MRWSWLAILLLWHPPVAMPQALPETPAPVRRVLSDMPKRAKALAKGHRELRNYEQAIDTGAFWLKGRLQDDDPVEYRLQLTVDDYLLGRAQANPAEASQIMKSVAEDVALKSRDCRRFGHGRRVPIEIRTVRAGVEENGWQVYYRWKPPGSLPVQALELCFPNPSSPSNWDLPVGMYEIHIEKKTASGILEKSNPTIIPVGLENRVTWQLQIP